MGRTVLAYSMAIEKVLSRFKSYRKVLREEDRIVFDQLMRIAKRQVQAGVMAQHPNAFDAMSMAMHISVQKQLNRLEEKIDVLLKEKEK